MLSRENLSKDPEGGNLPILDPKPFLSLQTRVTQGANQERFLEALSTAQSPGRGSVLGAAFRQENLLVSGLLFAGKRRFGRKAGYNSFIDDKDIVDRREYLAFADKFLDSDSPDETRQ